MGTVLYREKNQTKPTNQSANQPNTSNKNPTHQDGKEGVTLGLRLSREGQFDTSSKSHCVPWICPCLEQPRFHGFPATVSLGLALREEMLQSEISRAMTSFMRPDFSPS